MNNTAARNGLILFLFCAALIGCVLGGLSVVPALLFGLALFLFDAALKGFKPRQMLEMCLSGIKTVKNILITLLLIGVLTALWRASGCIPAIVSAVSGLIRPAMFLPLTFLLCGLISVLTGTAFGTAATMGVICMSIARSMEFSVLWTGGAILAGCFFGDRCSPVSTSALLVATVTKTDIYQNIGRMIRTCIVPFCLSLVLYLLLSLGAGSATGTNTTTELLQSSFTLNLWCFLPALAILIPAFFRVPVRPLLLLSIVISIPVTLFVQRFPLVQLPGLLLNGFAPQDPHLAAVLGGGGLVSMVRTTCIILIAACYSGIFKATGLLDFLIVPLRRLAEKGGSFASMLAASVFSAMVSCNQTLAIMLTDQMTAELTEDPLLRAQYLENSAVVISPLIPWCIACSVPLSSVEAPAASVLFAFYLILLPLWQLLRSRVKGSAKV